MLVVDAEMGPLSLSQTVPIPLLVPSSQAFIEYLLLLKNSTF